MRSCVWTRRHCEEQGDEAIQLSICGAKGGLLRFARKDVDGAHLPTRYSVICEELLRRSNPALFPHDGLLRFASNDVVWILPPRTSVIPSSVETPHSILPCS